MIILVIHVLEELWLLTFPSSLSTQFCVKNYLTKHNS